MGYTKVGPSPIVNFTSEYAKPLVSLKTNIVAQGGGGTPSSPIPIVGKDNIVITHTGKNLFNKSTITTGKYFDSNGDIQNSSSSAISDYIKINPSTNYHFGIWYGSSVSRYSCWYDKNKNLITTFRPNYSGETLTTPNNAYYVRLSVGVDYAEDYQLEVGSTATNYAPYNADTFTLPLGQTIYGGYVDWENGKLVVTHEIVDLGSLNWTKESYNQKYHWYSSVKSDTKNNTSFNTVVDLLCSTYESKATNVLYGGIQGISFYDTRFYLYDVDWDNASAIGTNFKAYLSGVKCVYELATHIEISLPTTMPNTIEGVQNWFADSGDIELCYTSFIEYHKVASVFVTPNSNVQIQTASGAIANFNTSLVLPLVALKAYIKAQGGGGTPTTPVAITGWDNVKIYQRGVNLWDEQWESGYIQSSGALTPNASSIRSKNFCVCKGGVQYYFLRGQNPNYPNICWYDSEQTFIERTSSQTGVHNAPDNARYFKISCYGYGATYNNDISINYPSTDTQYHAYNPNSTEYTIQLGQTVYGGYVDWKNGKLVVTHKMLDLTDLGAWNSGYANENGYIRFNKRILDKKMGLSNVITSDIFQYSNTLVTNTVSSPIISGNSENFIYFGFPASLLTGDLSTTEGRNTALYDWIENNSFNVIYELATPIEIDLPTTMPSTISGVQNWFADSGNIEVSFKKIAETRDLIL